MRHNPTSMLAMMILLLALSGERQPPAALIRFEAEGADSKQGPLRTGGSLRPGCGSAPSPLFWASLFSHPTLVQRILILVLSTLRRFPRNEAVERRR